MAIEYVEIRDTDRSVVGIVDTAKSIIWHSVYYGVGDFEIYAPATEKHINLLVAGNYVTRNDNDEIGIIESVNISYNEQDGQMLTATGRFAKSILDRRIIYNLSGTTNRPAIISGNVEIAVRKLVTDNAINCSFDSNRNIDILELGVLANIPEIIIDENGDEAEKQVTCENLLDYTDALLKEYNLSSKIILNDDTKKLQFVVFKGVNRSTDNIDGNEPIIFGEEFDNLPESQYLYNTTEEKNVAIIGGEEEDTVRFYSLLTKGASGLNRRETFVDASSIKKTYKDEQDVEHTYTDAEYKKVLNVQGTQELSTLVKIESFDGTLDFTYSQWEIGQDFTLGDIVTIQDNKINKYMNVRIVETTEAQDENGYTIEAVYQ